MSILSNEHLYCCKKLKQTNNTLLPYNKIFNGTIPEQKVILNILKENLTFYKDNTQ